MKFQEYLTEQLKDPKFRVYWERMNNLPAQAIEEVSTVVLWLLLAVDAADEEKIQSTKEELKEIIAKAQTNPMYREALELEEPVLLEEDGLDKLISDFKEALEIESKFLP